MNKPNPSRQAHCRLLELTEDAHTQAQERRHHRACAITEPTMDAHTVRRRPGQRGFSCEGTATRGRSPGEMLPSLLLSFSDEEVSNSALKSFVGLVSSFKVGLCAHTHNDKYFKMDSRESWLQRMTLLIRKHMRSTHMNAPVREG